MTICIRPQVVVYAMKFIDRAKITALFDADAYKLPPLETPLAKDIFYGVIIGIICGGIAGIIIYTVRKKKKSK